MARPRLPTNVLKLKGAYKKDPQRLKARENEPENKKAIGNPPTHLDKSEKAAFREIVKLSIDGVLGEADRLAVEMAAKLLIICRGQRVVNGEVVLPTASEQNQFFKYLCQFGMTPADRSKVSVPKAKEKNPFDE
jgi:phage terminase small subunit